MLPKWLALIGSLCLFSAHCSQKKFNGSTANRPAIIEKSQVQVASGESIPPTVNPSEIKGSPDSIPEKGVTPIAPHLPEVSPEPKPEPTNPPPTAPTPPPPVAPAPAPQPMPAPIPTPIVPPTFTVEFGADEIFHIGDGAVGSGSACVGEVKTHELHGTRYYFEFEVLNDATSVDLTIAKICGVDAVDKNTVQVLDAGKKATTMELPIATDKVADRSKAWAPYATLKLNKGKYSVVVNSKNVLGKDTSTPGKDEHDDFLIGKIRLKADKDVKFSRIFAE